MFPVSSLNQSNKHLQPPSYVFSPFSTGSKSIMTAVDSV